MACPFLEMGYRECRNNLTMKNLDKALGNCANDYTECRVYHELFQRKMVRGKVFRRNLTRRTA